MYKQWSIVSMYYDFIYWCYNNAFWHVKSITKVICNQILPVDFGVRCKDVRYNFNKLMMVQEETTIDCISSIA